MSKIKKSNQPKPPTLTEHSFKKKVMVKKPIDRCWEFLNRMDTFTDGQVFPYRVEFVSENENEEPSFTTGTWTNHHGPLLNAAGKIVTMNPFSYRDLHYTYGSYALSFRLLRPVRLQFFFEEIDKNKTSVRVQFDTYVPNWFSKLWTFTQYFFWKPFFLSISLSIKH